jgi:hypothetical protein
MVPCCLHAFLFDHLSGCRILSFILLGCLPLSSLSSGLVLVSELVGCLPLLHPRDVEFYLEVPQFPLAVSLLRFLQLIALFLNIVATPFPLLKCILILVSLLRVCLHPVTHLTPVLYSKIARIRCMMGLN